jgi:hypothetical protein
MVDFTESLLAAAENSLRDIRERVEHAQGVERLMSQINQICDNYWKYRRQKEKELDEIRQRIDEMRRELEACLPKSCVKCQHRLIDGAPEPHPICGHPSIKTLEDAFIIDLQKNPPDFPPKCPLKNEKK